MLCQKCKKEIPDGSAFCLFCGKKQSGTPAIKKKGKRRKRENGTGSVYKLSGSRKKPWVVSFTSGYDENGKRLGAILGYYASEKEALNALENLPLNIMKDSIRITLRQLYDYGPLNFISTSPQKESKDIQAPGTNGFTQIPTVRSLFAP